MLWSLGDHEKMQDKSKFRSCEVQQTASIVRLSSPSGNGRDEAKVRKGSLRGREGASEVQMGSLGGCETMNLSPTSHQHAIMCREWTVHAYQLPFFLTRKSKGV